MREAISNTAELGAVTGGPRIVDERVRAEMRDILASIRSGEFAGLLSDEATAATRGCGRLAQRRPTKRLSSAQRLGDLTTD